MEWSGGKGTQTRLATARTITTASFPPPEIGSNRHGGNQPTQGKLVIRFWVALTRDREPQSGHGNHPQAGAHEGATTSTDRGSKRARREEVRSLHYRLLDVMAWWGIGATSTSAGFRSFSSRFDLVSFSIYRLNGENRGVTTTYHVTCLFLERHFLFVACSFNKDIWKRILNTTNSFSRVITYKIYRSSLL